MWIPSFNICLISVSTVKLMNLSSCSSKSTTVILPTYSRRPASLPAVFQRMVRCFMLLNVCIFLPSRQLLVENHSTTGFKTTCRELTLYKIGLILPKSMPHLLLLLLCHCCKVLHKIKYALHCHITIVHIYLPTVEALFSLWSIRLLLQSFKFLSWLDNQLFLSPRPSTQVDSLSFGFQ